MNKTLEAAIETLLAVSLVVSIGVCLVITFGYYSSYRDYYSPYKILFDLLALSLFFLLIFLLKILADKFMYKTLLAIAIVSGAIVTASPYWVIVVFGEISRNTIRIPRQRSKVMIISFETFSTITIIAGVSLIISSTIVYLLYKRRQAPRRNSIVAK